MRSPKWDRKEEEADSPSGDDSIIARCYRRYAPKLFDYLCLHIQSSNDAEDMLFEVFLVALEHERGLSSMLEDEQRAWLWTVTRNKIIDHHRRHNRRRFISLDDLAEMIDDQSTPDEISLQHEEHEHLHTQLKQLSGLQQEVLELRFTAGLHCAEIAVVMNKKEGAIRTMLSRALNTLRSIYGQ